MNALWVYYELGTEAVNIVKMNLMIQKAKISRVLALRKQHDTWFHGNLSTQLSF